MPEDTTQKINILQTELDELKQKVESLTNNPVGVLTDIKTKDNISDIIEDRIHEIIWDKVFIHSTVFESVDRYATSGAGSATATSSGLTLNDTAGSIICTLQIEADTILFPDKETFFSTVVSIDDVSETNFDVIILSGSSGGYCGFTIDEGTIQGFSYDGTTLKTINVGTATDGTPVLLEAIYYPGTRVEFFVDGTLEGTVTSNLRSISTDVTEIVTFNMDPDGGMAGAIADITFFKILQKQD